ncbi:hypothetical protein BGZ65_004679 [Modicella reniformis]|uniref:Helitron helicase-like domain-containing protein n=1 Tax=Modicella reniformis TaxID=1440133 RepID=A0A9P6LYS7_9FUNG|nr:hypothetical protein BGZ65_004679 [Modicella reniformis]
MPYLCKICTFTKFIFPPRAQGSRIALPHLDGSVAIYQANQSVFGQHHGLSAFVFDRNLPVADKTKIRAAYDWLIQNNPLYYGFQVVDPSDIPHLPQHEQGGVRRRHGFETQILSQPDPGPQVAEEALGDLAAGIDMVNNAPVKFSDQNLVVSLFPEIYIFGHSAFQLAHQRESLRGQLPLQEPQALPPFIQHQHQQDQVEEGEDAEDEGEAVVGEEEDVDVEGGNDDNDDDDDMEEEHGSEDEYLPSEESTRESTTDNDELEDEDELGGGSRSRFTIKNYAKLRLLHFDRTWGENARFLSFFFYWVNKDTVYGYRLRSTSATRGQREERRPTNVSDVMQAEDGGQCFPWDDIPKFVCAYNREWSRVWNFIRKTWSDKLLGGLKAWFWVTEFQDRGVPHVHFVLWSNWSVEELVEANNSGNRRRVIITTSSEPVQDVTERYLERIGDGVAPPDVDLAQKD